MALLNRRPPVSRSQADLSPTWWTEWNSRMGIVHCAVRDGPRRMARILTD